MEALQAEALTEARHIMIDDDQPQPTMTVWNWFQLVSIGTHGTHGLCKHNLGCEMARHEEIVFVDVFLWIFQMPRAEVSASVKGSHTEVIGIWILMDAH